MVVLVLVVIQILEQMWVYKSQWNICNFLKDGSVDSNSYALASSLGNYLPLSGGIVYGRLYLGNSSNNGYLDMVTNGSPTGTN